MATSFLDKTGLASLWTKIKSTFALKSEIPDSTSDLTNDSGFITAEDIPQSDWNQKDNTANDYIKNRICYTGDEVMTQVIRCTIPSGEQNIRLDYYGIFTDAIGQLDLRSWPDLSGIEYSVQINDATYNGNAQYSEDDEFSYIGNGYLEDSSYEDNGLPFYCDLVESLKLSQVASEDTNVTVSLMLPQIYKIDDKYLNVPLRSGVSYGSVILGNTQKEYVNGNFSVSEGRGSTFGAYSHADGEGAAFGLSSHAENRGHATGEFSHAENGANAMADYSHAENLGEASGEGSHAEGRSSTLGLYSHAEGVDSDALGEGSHAEGYNTIAQNKYQHVFGKYNISDTSGNNSNELGNFVEIVGNGEQHNQRSNARTLDWNGNEVLAGKLTVGAAPTANMDVATKKYVDDAVAGSGSAVTYTLSITNNVITLTGSDGSTSSVTLPVYTGGVSS